MNCEMRKLQKEEALERMNFLKIHDNAIKEFEKEEKINLSFNGCLYWLNNDEKQMICEWEQRTNNIVYHVIKNYFEFGICYTYLYVSKEQEEWEMDRNEIFNGYPYAYVENTTCEWCSEYGCVGIKSWNGGVLRIA